MLALTLIICAVSALILPVTVKLRLYVDFNDKRAFYSIFLFGFIRVNSGYLSIKENLLTVHFSDSKAYAAELKSLMPNKNSADLLTHFNFVKIKSSAIIGGEDELKNFVTAAILNAINAATFSALRGMKRYTDYRCDIYLTDADTKAFFTDVTISFNLLCLLEIIIKNIYGSLKNVKES